MNPLRVHLGCIVAVIAAALSGAAAPAQVVERDLPEQVRGLDVIERLGEQVPLDAKITDSDGNTVELGTYFEPTADGRDVPVIMALVYYDCPVACPATLNAISQCVRALDYTVGEDFRIVVVSFDPTNTTEQAREEEHYALLAYGRKSSAARSGYRFHTATADEARRIADSVGFQYRYLPDVDQYGHPSAVFVLSPDGVVSRYMYGYQFFPGQMRLALLEASQGRIARSFGDKIRLFCYSYDPDSGAYTLKAWMVMRIVGVITVIALAGLVALLKVHEVRNRAKAPARRRRTRLKQDAAPTVSPALDGPVRSVR